MARSKWESMDSRVSGHIYSENWVIVKLPVPSFKRNIVQACLSRKQDITGRLIRGKHNLPLKVLKKCYTTHKTIRQMYKLIVTSQCRSCWSFIWVFMQFNVKIAIYNQSIKSGAFNALKYCRIILEGGCAAIWHLILSQTAKSQIYQVLRRLDNTAWRHRSWSVKTCSLHVCFGF